MCLSSHISQQPSLDLEVNDPCHLRLSLDPRFLPLVFEPAAWCTLAFLIREETFCTQPLLFSPCAPSMSFAFLVLCLPLCLSRGAMGAEFVVSIPLLFPGKDSTAELSTGGLGARVAASQGTRRCWLVGKGWDREGHPGLGAQGHTLGLHQGALLYPRCSICALSPPLFWGRFCCTHSVLQP